MIFTMQYNMRNYYLKVTNRKVYIWERGFKDAEFSNVYILIDILFISADTK